jgi:predicted AlkP superfamily pyrophosphatase or phosphodiesterase
VAVTNPGTIRWSFPELPTADQQIPREMIQAGLLTEEQLGWFRSKNSTWRDMVWTQAACHIVRTRQPNLLMYHLLNTDAINHGTGPATYSSFTAYAYADRLIGDLLDAIEQSGMKDKTTIVFTTDHGFKRVKKVILPNVALREAGLVRTSGSKILSCDAYVMAQGGLAFAYVTDPAKRAEVLPKLREICEGLEGVDRVIDGSEGHKLGMPTPAEHEGMGDLVLYAKQDYAFQAFADRANVVETSTGYLGTHGYPNSDPELDGIFIAWGYGIKPGQIKRVSNLDVAPTLAELLDVKLGEVDGRALKEILK